MTSGVGTKSEKLKYLKAQILILPTEQWTRHLEMGKNKIKVKLIMVQSN